MSYFIKKNILKTENQLRFNYSKMQYYSIGQILTVFKSKKIREKYKQMLLVLFCTKDDLQKMNFQIGSYEEIRHKIIKKLLKRDTSQPQKDFQAWLSKFSVKSANDQNGINSTVYYGS